LRESVIWKCAVSQIVNDEHLELRAGAAGDRSSRRRFSPRLRFEWLGPISFVVELIGVIGASVVSGVVYNQVVLGHSGDIDSFVAAGAAAFLYYGVVSLYRGNYSARNLTSRWKQAREITFDWLAVYLFLLGIAFLLKIQPNFSRGATSCFFVLGWLFLICWRLFLIRYIAAARAAGGLVQRPIVLIGDAQLLHGSPLFYELAEYGYHVAKLITFNDQNDSLPVAEAVRAVRSDARIEEVFLAVNWQHVRRIDDFARELSVIPLSVTLLPDTNVLRFLSKPRVQVGPLPAAELQRRPLTLGERGIKRIFDFVLATSMAFVLLPLLAVVAVLIKCDTSGPIFFTQTRGGFNGRPFRIFKFRTLTTREDGSEVRQVSRDDYRLTRIGRVLRRTSIDEFPQLLNVIRGEMSLVGPRPHATAHNSEYEQLIGNYAFRHHVKPGLTGWAQINGFRGEADIDSMKQRVDCDLWYIDNWNLGLDVKIIAKTLGVLFRQPTAY